MALRASRFISNALWWNHTFDTYLCSTQYICFVTLTLKFTSETRTPTITDTAYTSVTTQTIASIITIITIIASLGASNKTMIETRSSLKSTQMSLSNLNRFISYPSIVLQTSLRMPTRRLSAIRFKNELSSTSRCEQ